MSITISKALQNELTDAIRYHNSQKLEDVKKEWLEEQVQAEFKRRCPDAPTACKTEDILEQLAAKGVGSDCITRSAKAPTRGYRSDRYADLPAPINLRMEHYSLQFRFGQVTEWKRGSYQSINAYLFQRTCCAELAWKHPADVAAWIIALDSLLPQWEKNDWPKVMRESQKMAKMEELNAHTIETMVRMKLKGTGIPFAIEEQKLRIKVYFLLADNTQLELYLSRKKFMEQMDAALNTVHQLYDLVQSTGLTIAVKRRNKFIRWQETDEKA